ncbi:MAG: hypothetical protein PHS54_05185 [Clostridia bacterium]|nr:hypothetical protein [Clostridia bacterium]
MKLTNNGVVFTTIDSMIEALNTMISRIDEGTIKVFGESSEDIEHIITQAGRFFYRKGKYPYSITKLKFKSFEDAFDTFIEKLEAFTDKIKEDNDYIVEDVVDRQSDVFMMTDEAYKQFNIGREEYRKQSKRQAAKERRLVKKKQNQGIEK